MKYIEGDLFKNLPSDVTVLIPHIVNNIHAWGSGFVVPLANRFPISKKKYMDEKVLELGKTQFISVDNFIICNMIAQNGIKNSTNKFPIKYNFLEDCMVSVGEKALKIRDIDGSVKIICPMFGSNRAGGDWEIIESMIKNIWNDLDIEIYYMVKYMPQGWKPH
jgi:hypothetical protein